MSVGRIFAVVGPSGAGKDTLMAAAQAAIPGLHLVRRVITRPEAAGGEPFEGVGEAEFQRRERAGGFALHWRAHGLAYGIPASVRETMASGGDVIFNGSRAMLDAAALAFPGLRVIHVTARPEVLARRLAARGRESAGQIAGRLARAVPPIPAGVPVTEIDNSDALEDAERAFIAAVQPEKV